MDYVTITLLGVGVLFALLVLLGLYYPGTGAEVIDWKPSRHIETQAELEASDLGQMLEAQNERRRKRGQQELTEAEMHRRAARDERIRARASRQADRSSLRREIARAEAEEAEAEPGMRAETERRIRDSRI